MSGDGETKRLVEAGYDRIADAYLERFGESSVRAAKLAQFIDGLPSGACLLDLGCGAGIPVARDLVAGGFAVTGVDLSAAQIERARRNVPAARFLQADITTLQFPEASFDGICAFYSLTHLPRAEHAGLLRRVAFWLRPGGRFLASFGASESEWSGEWLGAPMFFSHHHPDAAKRLVSEAGLELARAEILLQDNEAAEFLWIAAVKPRGPDLR